MSLTENVLAQRRPVLEGIFLLCEGLAWFIVIAVIATLTEEAFVQSLADRIELALPTEFRDPAAAEIVLAQLRAAAGTDAGPPLLVVLAAAFGGFGLMRLVPKLDLGTGFGAALLVAASILGVNLLLHLAMGDLRIWDASELVALFGADGSRSASTVDLEAYVADPNVNGPHAGALGVTFIGLSAVWFRFLLAGRQRVGLDRMARSFTVSFAAVFIALFVAQAAEIEAAGRWAVPQFVLGMLGLALGNYERTVPAGSEQANPTPWLTSVGGTLGLLAGAAAVIALLAYVQFGAVLSAAGDVLLVVIEFVAILIVTPIYWLVAGVMGFLLGGASFGDNLPDILRQPVTPGDVGVEEGDEGVNLPGWLWDSIRFFAFVGLIYVMYLVGRRILGARPERTLDVEEVREQRAGGAGLGQLLADLVQWRPGRGDRWLESNEVYRHFGRALGISNERGLTMLPSETPDEFGRSALTYLGAEPVADAARMFERARYGRHWPDREELREASRALGRWDSAHPATEEVRARIRGHRPISDVDQVRVRMALARRGLNPTDDSILRGE